VRVGLKFVLMKANASERGAMIACAEAEGVEYSIDPTITGRYDGTSGSLATGSTRRRSRRSTGPLKFLIKPGPAEPTDDQFKCNCARGNAAVSSTGSVPLHRDAAAGGLDPGASFSEIWNESPVFRWIRGLRVADFKTCAPCGLKSWCRRSPGPAYLLTGDYTGVDPGPAGSRHHPLRRGKIAGCFPSTHLQNANAVI
jgi:MoaA/NifB/PqqE/SkfB family radical SAM enzyme